MANLGAAMLALLAAGCGAAASGEDLTVLAGDSGAKAFEAALKSEFYRMTERRSAAFEKTIKSAAAMRVWQSDRRDFFLRQIGGLPARTPLNPQITGTLQGKGYRVEKLVLETRPGFHLTANLYLPETPGPWPAVLVACGHSHDGKASGHYQLACMLLARPSNCSARRRAKCCCSRVSAVYFRSMRSRPPR